MNFYSIKIKLNNYEFNILNEYLEAVLKYIYFICKVIYKNVKIKNIFNTF